MFTQKSMLTKSRSSPGAAAGRQPEQVRHVEVALIEK